MDEKENKKEKSTTKLWLLVLLGLVALIFSNYLKLFHSSTWGERWKGDATFWNLFAEPGMHLPVLILFGLGLIVAVLSVVIWNYWRKD